jgi:hypothetical protein
MKLYYVYIAIVLFFTSCDKLLIKPDGNYDPEKNFETFWSDINSTYPFFEYDHVNWDSIYRVYRPKVTATTSNDELFEIFKDMMRPLVDGHVRLIKPNGEIWENERHFVYRSYFNFSNINHTYLADSAHFISWNDYNNSSKMDTILRYGFVNSNILYFDIRTFETSYNYERILDSLLRAVDFKGLILDVRGNGGGLLSTMKNTLSPFISDTKTYGYSRQKIGPLNNFGPMYSLTFTHNAADTVFTKNIVVLTSRYTFSAAEHFRMALKTLPNVTVVGDTTGGALSPIVERQLPNGIKYIITSSITYDLNLNIHEKVGFDPDYTVITPSSDSIAKKDDMIEKAIQILP